jgi:dolichol-phosphate mannosyltransferase
MFADRSLMVIIPAYNEEELIAETVANLPADVDEILLVDDGSTDATVERALSAGDDRLRVVKHGRNRGVGAAIRTGYRQACSRGMDVAVVVGGDSQMDPTEMSDLLMPILENRADYAKGTRLTHPELHLRMPWQRRLGNRVLTALTRAAIGLNELTDAQCGYTAITRRAIEQLDLDGLWPGYGYPNDLLSRLYCAGLRVVECPVTPIYGREKSGIRPVMVLPIYGYVLLRAYLRRLGRL